MPPVISISGGRLVESSSTSPQLEYLVTLSEAASSTIDVSYRAVAGTAFEDIDYFDENSLVRFFAGQTSQIITIELQDFETLDEADETILVELSNPTGGAVLAGGGTTLRSTGFILDDDGSSSNLALFVDNATLVEGDGSPAQFAEVVLSLSRPSSQAFDVDYVTTPGTATSGADFTALNGTVTFLAGQVSAAVLIPIVGDDVIEIDETFSITFTPEVGALNSNADIVATVTIQDDDGVAELLTGTTMNDTLNGDADDEMIYGLEGNDILFGDIGDDTLNGNAGDDVFSTGSGSDLVFGGAGNDTLGIASSSDLSDLFDGGDGIDRVVNATGADLILPTLPAGWSNVEELDAAGFAILGDAGANALDLSSLTILNSFFISGEGGADVITGTQLADTIIGGAGSDTINASGGDDIINGQSGIDTLLGGLGSDTLAYVDVSDTLDTFDGGSGIDSVLNVSGGDFVLPSIPGTWMNFEVFDGGGEAITGDGADNTLDFSSFTVVNALFLGGGDGNDSITGTSQGDTMVGGDGMDTLIGGDGNDIFNGLAGVDSIEGGLGNDSLAYLDVSDLSDVFDGGTGTDVILNVTGSDFVLPTLPGTWTNFEVIDGAGNALLGDNAGTLMDFSGVDLVNVLGISGQGGNDTMIGTSGADFITGAQGADTLTGGAGDDVFVMAVGFGSEVITDFVAGTGTDDQLNVALMGSDFDTFAEVINAASDVGGNTLIDFGGGDSFTLNGVASNTLTMDDFAFVI